MLSSVLRSRRAIEVNIAIMRTFVRLRQMLASDEALYRKLAITLELKTPRGVELFRSLRAASSSRGA